LWTILVGVPPSDKHFGSRDDAGDAPPLQVVFATGERRGRIKLLAGLSFWRSEGKRVEELISLHSNAMTLNQHLDYEISGKKRLKTILGSRRVQWERLHKVQTIWLAPKTLEDLGEQSSLQQKHFTSPSTSFSD
jgi:hypothetical protein